MSAGTANEDAAPHATLVASPTQSPRSSMMPPPRTDSSIPLVGKPWEPEKPLQRPHTERDACGKGMQCTAGARATRAGGPAAGWLAGGLALRIRMLMEQAMVVGRTHASWTERMRQGSNACCTGRTHASWVDRSTASTIARLDAHSPAWKHDRRYGVCVCQSGSAGSCALSYSRSYSDKHSNGRVPDRSLHQAPRRRVPPRPPPRLTRRATARVWG